MSPSHKHSYDGERCHVIIQWFSSSRFTFGGLKRKGWENLGVPEKGFEEPDLKRWHHSGLLFVPYSATWPHPSARKSDLALGPRGKRRGFGQHSVKWNMLHLNTLFCLSSFPDVFILILHKDAPFSYFPPLLLSFYYWITGALLTFPIFGQCIVGTEHICGAPKRMEPIFLYVF